MGWFGHKRNCEGGNWNKNTCAISMCNRDLLILLSAHLFLVVVAGKRRMLTSPAIHSHSQPHQSFCLSGNCQETKDPAIVLLAVWTTNDGAIERKNKYRIPNNLLLSSKTHILQQIFFFIKFCNDISENACHFLHSYGHRASCVVVVVIGAAFGVCRMPSVRMNAHSTVAMAKLFLQWWYLFVPFIVASCHTNICNVQLCAIAHCWRASFFFYLAEQQPNFRNTRNVSGREATRSIVCASVAVPSTIFSMYECIMAKCSYANHISFVSSVAHCHARTAQQLWLFVQRISAG